MTTNDIKTFNLTTNDIKTFNLTTNDIKTFNLFDQVLNDNAGESYRTIWEIYCYQQYLNEDNQGRESKLFDMWVDNKTFGNTKKSLVD